VTDFLTSNDWRWRLARTIVQGVIAVIIANLDMLVGVWQIDPSIKAVVVALIMAVLSPVMALLGGEPDAIEGGSE